MDPLTLRFIERITAVLIGGIAIYLGYRLFDKVPEQRDSGGKVKLPWDISVVLTRVGPGIFFALFGAATVSLALFRPVEMKDGNLVAYAGGGAGAVAGSHARADARALLRRDIATLNTIPQMLPADLAEHERESVSRTLRRVKLSLIRPVWGEPAEGFGDMTQFEKWVLADEQDAPPAGMDGALALYRSNGN